MTLSKPVFFFDIDNTLYSRSKRVHNMMSELISKYFVEQLSLSIEDAEALHQKYYKEYGLAIEGLVRNHKIDPMEYNEKVDDALPLDNVITPDPLLRKLFQDFDRSKVKLWLFTNAYINHAKRVTKLLGIDDQFDGVTFCDYNSVPMYCKPMEEMFTKAETEAQADASADCYFVDDSALNCTHAESRGWNTVHKIELGDANPDPPVCKYLVRDLEELRDCFPQFFKSRSGLPNGHT